MKSIWVKAAPFSVLALHATECALSKGGEATDGGVEQLLLKVVPGQRGPGTSLPREPIAMKNEDTLQDEKDACETAAEDSKTESAANEAEFKVTVRKLEVPVRPRGVLAE